MQICEEPFLVAKLLCNSLCLFIRQSVRNAMVRMWFFPLLFTEIGWNFRWEFRLPIGLQCIIYMISLSVGRSWFKWQKYLFFRKVSWLYDSFHILSFGTSTFYTFFSLLFMDGCCHPCLHYTIRSVIFYLS